jgi:hypothetical protein
MAIRGVHGLVGGDGESHVTTGAARRNGSWGAAHVWFQCGGVGWPGGQG